MMIIVLYSIVLSTAVTYMIILALCYNKVLSYVLYHELHFVVVISLYIHTFPPIHLHSLSFINICASINNGMLEL